MLKSALLRISTWGSPLVYLQYKSRSAVMKPKWCNLHGVWLLTIWHCSHYLMGFTNEPNRIIKWSKKLRNPWDLPQRFIPLYCCKDWGTTCKSMLSFLVDKVSPHESGQNFSWQSRSHVCRDILHREWKNQEVILCTKTSMFLVRMMVSNVNHICSISLDKIWPTTKALHKDRSVHVLQRKDSFQNWILMSYMFY